ncbi:MAG: agmatinase [Thermoguttaceae bacterium]
MSSFFVLPPELCNPQTAKYRVVPVPYQGTVCFVDGTEHGPEAILSVSNQVEHFDEELLVSVTKKGIATFPPIPPAYSPEAEYERIYETVSKRGDFAKDHFPIYLGGEHSITPPIVKAASEVYDNVSVLQFDAHADLRDSYTGSHFSHACAMRRVLEWTPHLVQVGIRSFSEEENRDMPDRIAKIVTPQKIALNWETSLKQILAGLTETVYITIDIDAFDPAFAPGTGTPEPGGLSWHEVLSILRPVCEQKNVIGADIVEVSPLGGHHVMTEFLAARLTAKIIAYTSGN